ncbi:hypothetical protein EFO10_11615 [Lactococcus cremoris]|nr:hypothetical protein [Lactococcus cremoris]
MVMTKNKNRSNLQYFAQARSAWAFFHSIPPHQSLTSDISLSVILKPPQCYQIRLYAFHLRCHRLL